VKAENITYIRDK